jgi:hypothetical protein
MKWGPRPGSKPVAALVGGPKCSNASGRPNGPAFDSPGGKRLSPLATFAGTLGRTAEKAEP